MTKSIKRQRNDKGHKAALTGMTSYSAPNSLSRVCAYFEDGLYIASVFGACEAIDREGWSTEIRERNGRPRIERNILTTLVRLMVKVALLRGRL